MPLIRRVPKRGFRHTQFDERESVVNVSDLERVFSAKASVTLQTLKEAGLVKGANRVKVLGDGEIKKGLTVQAHAFSASAKAKIEKAGGQVEVLKA